MTILKRKLDDVLQQWHSRSDRLPLIVKGARQIGKTYSIRAFATANYVSVIEINFVLQPRYRIIFDDGYEARAIVRNITLLDPAVNIVPGNTLLFFDEIQACPAATTSLKSFAVDSDFDVVCSGSLMGINYAEIESNAVGYKEDYEMFSLDFEEFLWARGYPSSIAAELLSRLLAVQPLSRAEYDTLLAAFRDYMVVGGMPAVVARYIAQGNFAGTLHMQRQLLLDYEEDITKYAAGLDRGRILNVYRHIATFLGQENKKFQITKVARGARSRDYVGVVDWLASAGIVNVCYMLGTLSLPLRGNCNTAAFKLYYQDTGLLIAALDDEAQEDLRANRNFGTYKGAVYENVVADMLRKQGYGLYYYRNEKSTMEVDFIVRSRNALVPVEVKADDATARSLRALKAKDNMEIGRGIKLCNRNIGLADDIITIPYFLTFLLKRYVSQW